MKKNKVAIIGYGIVGKGMHKIFPDALIYDPAYPYYEINVSRNIDTFKVGPGATIMASASPKEIKKEVWQKEINDECDLAIVCVPTPPMGMKGKQKVNEDETEFKEVDLSIIHDVFSWLKVPNVLIKSTIPPGTTDYLIKTYDIKTHELNICFSPEYMGESKYYTPPKYPDPEDPRQHSFMIIGGHPKGADRILKYFAEKLGPTKFYYKCTALEAELIKYMENTWGAMKVTFGNEWYEICKAFNASYYAVREGWALDNRVEKMHSMAFEDNRGFGGKCYPKDLLGIVAQAEKAGYSPDLLKEVWESNKRFRNG